MKHITPRQTLFAIIPIFYQTLTLIQQNEISRNSMTLNTDLSPSVFLNGIVAHKILADSEWKLVYNNDESCKSIIEILKKLSLSNKKELMLKVHYFYRAWIQDSSISYVNDRLILSELTVINTQSIKLMIVLTDLQKHIFNSFHTNPIGGHFSLYQTLHGIQLRYHWPQMFKYIKHQIQSCAACLLKNNAAHPSSELLYSFPLDAPMNTMHAELWSPVKQSGYDSHTALMIVVCHMTTFVAIKPVKEQNSKSFAKAVYQIMMRYGLAALIVTDPDSKFNKRIFWKVLSSKNPSSHELKRQSQCNYHWKI